jgi:5-methylcytosine-specific restriction protein A
MPKRIPYARAGLPPPRAEEKVERDSFYASKTWRVLRAAFLAANPLCAECLKKNLVTEARIVHHVIERLKAPHRALDWDNLESICDACHTAEHQRRKKGNT